MMTEDENDLKRAKKLKSLHQYYVRLEENEKDRKLLDLLDTLKFDQVVIFVRSLHRCRALNQLLVEKNFSTSAIHRAMSQEDRRSCYQQFKDSPKCILVTNLFGRGIEHADLVFNYDMPILTGTYLHRVGPALRFGIKGMAITFVSDETDTSTLNSVQSRFDVTITEVPDEIDVGNPVTLMDLPEDVMVLIVQSLNKCLDRIRVGWVCQRLRNVASGRGWSDVRDLRQMQGTLQLSNELREEVFKRAGRYITRMELEEQETINVGTLREELTKCPELMHLAMYWHQLDADILSHISTFPHRFKSLRIFEVDFPASDTFPQILSEASQAIRQCSSLEYVELGGPSHMLRDAHLRFPSLANLCYLKLCFIRMISFNQGDALGVRNIEALCSLPSLRSLSLMQWWSEPSFDFLPLLCSRQALECLEISSRSIECIDYIATALPHLGQSLLALNVKIRGMKPIPMLAAMGLFSSIANNLRQLKVLKVLLYGDFASSDGRDKRPREAANEFYDVLFSPTSMLDAGRLDGLMLEPQPESRAEAIVVPPAKMEKYRYLHLSERPNFRKEYPWF